MEEDAQISNGAKRGVVLVNTGSPSAPTPDAVKEYLHEFLTDPRIVPMDENIWNFILEAFILPSRSKKSANLYRQIWTDEGSPLLVIHESMARKLDELMGEGVEVVSAMNYGRPKLDDAIEDLISRGCEMVTVVPTYPQSAYSQAVSVRDHLTHIVPNLSEDIEIDFVENYYDNELYIKAISDSVTDAGFGTRKDDRLLMLFHSIPMADIEDGDTYPQQVEVSTRLIAGDLALVEGEWSVGFQSRFDKGRKWLEPYAKEAVDEAIVKDRLFVVCPGFAADCLETLHSIKIQLREYYGKQHPGREFVYVPCLNDSDAQVEMLADVVRRHWAELDAGRKAEEE